MKRALKAKIKRRSSIEPMIGHMKADGRLGRNYLKGSLGDMMNAILSGAGQSLRKLLNYLKQFFALILGKSAKIDWVFALSVLIYATNNNRHYS